MYMYITCSDAGTLLSCLNNAIICVCVIVFVCVLSVIVFVQMCMRRFVITFNFLSICEHSNLYLPSFPLCVL